MNASTNYMEHDQNAGLGLTASNLRSDTTGASEIKYFAIGGSSLGLILVARSERGVCAIFLDDNPDLLVRDLQDRFPGDELMGEDGECKQLVVKVASFIARPALGLDLLLDIQGTVFQQRVWQAVRQIPAGSTASYTDIANQIGMPKSVRAVARACGAKPLAVVIPCHRVVRSNGVLSGYRWGVERKCALLDGEVRA